MEFRPKIYILGKKVWLNSKYIITKKTKKSFLGFFKFDIQ